MKLIKRILGVVTAAALSVTAFSGVIDKNIVSEFFVAESETASGTCGENVSWELDSEGTLRIYGTGEMDDWGSYNTLWADENIELSIKKVVIENGVTTICARAFTGCENLTEIIIPESVTSIGSQAFYGCENLTSIEIPNSVTSIGSYAFDYCESLESITIPDSVTSIESFGFAGCDNLTNIDVSTDNVSYSSISGVLFNKEQTELLKHPARNIRTKYIIPDSVTSIGYNAFSECRSLTDITIPDSVTSIGSRAFYECENLTSITIPDSVTEIGGAVFSYCFSLKDVTLSNNIASLKNSDFYGFFDACTSLTSIKIPDSVTSIGYRAFGGCENLTGITIPDSVTGIGEGAFSRCENLTDVYYSGTQEEWNAIEIGSYNECLDNAQIHTIGTMVASGTCGENVSWELDAEGTLRIFGTGEMDDWWSYNTLWVDENIELSIKKVVIENGVTTIGARTFAGCKNLTEIIIPESVTSIKYRAFFGCSNLENITLPSGITCIDEKVFYDCVKLADITIPDGVISIEYGAFYNCESLKSIIIPKSVTKIAGEAFAYCDSLTDIYYNGTQEEWNKILIDDLTKEDLKNITIHFNSSVIEEHIDFYEENKSNFINPENNTLMTDLRYEALNDFSVDVYEQMEALKKALEGDFSGVEWNEKLATETVLTEILSSEEFVGALSDNMQKDTEYYTDAIIDYIGIQAATLGITGDKLEELQELIKTSGNQAGKMDWLKKYFKSIDVGMVGTILEAVGLFYNVNGEISTAHDDIEKYVGYASYLNTNETAKEALKLLDKSLDKEKAKAVNAIRELGNKYESLTGFKQAEEDVETMSIEQITDIIEKAYEYQSDPMVSENTLVEAEDIRLIRQHKRTISLADTFASYNFDTLGTISIDEYMYETLGKTSLQICSYIATYIANYAIGLFCPQVSLILNGLNISLTVGINVWEEISAKLNCSISDRAMERDMYMNLFVYHSAITNAMTCSNGFGETLKSEKTMESLELFEEGFSMYKKIRNLCLSYGASYAGIRQVAKSEIFDISGEKYGFGVTSALMTADIAKTTEFVCHEIETTNIAMSDCFDMIMVACPVDVYIYNGDNIAVQSVGDVVTVFEENTFAEIDLIRLSAEQENAAKTCIVPEGYELKIVGNGEGTMSVEKVSVNNSEVETSAVFYEIPVKLNEEYTISENVIKNVTSDIEYEADVYEENAVPGDANNDGKINVRDCAFIATALAKGQADTLSSNADYSGDGKINVRDAAAIASALAKGEIK